MDVVTVFGVKWRVASYKEFFIIIIFIVVLAAFYFLFRYYNKLKNEKLHNYNLFLFKMKRLGLSNFQIKIINNMVDILGLANPNRIFEQPELFENAIGRFMLFLKNRDEQTDSLSDICKDITITYEKMFYPASFRRPVDDLTEIEDGILLYFSVREREVYLGKMLSKDKTAFTLMLFRSPKEVQKLQVNEPVKVFIWRLGDAEYEFESTILNIEMKQVRIAVPAEFRRAREFRLPYIEVIVPATIEKAKPRPAEEPAPVNGTLIKINDYEAVMKLAKSIDYRFEYNLRFVLNGFNFNIKTTVLSNRTVEEEDVVYYTLKFEGMSDAARKVLKKYMYEHL